MEKKANFKDVGLSYLLSIIFVFAVSIILTNILTAVSNINNIDVNVLSQENWVTYLNLFLSEIIFVAVFFIIVSVRKDKNFTKTYRIKCKFDYKILIAVVLFSIFSVLVCVNVTNLFNLGFSNILQTELTNSLGITMNSFGSFLLCAFLLAVLPAICEELVFRGIIYNGLRQRFNCKISVILSAVMFMLIHLSIYKSFYQFILGIILALLVYYTGSIVYGMVFHFVNNFFIILLNYICGNKTIFEFASFGVKEIVLSILIFIIGIYCAVLLFRALKNYTNQHKNYFNLEETNNPLQDNNLNNKNFNELTYEERILLNNKESDGLGIFLCSFFIVLILWSFNSFGGFI